MTLRGLQRAGRNGKSIFTSVDFQIEIRAPVPILSSPHETADLIWIEAQGPLDDGVGNLHYGYYRPRSLFPQPLAVTTSLLTGVTRNV